MNLGVQPLAELLDLSRRNSLTYGLNRWLTVFEVLTWDKWVGHHVIYATRKTGKNWNALSVDGTHTMTHFVVKYQIEQGLCRK